MSAMTEEQARETTCWRTLHCAPGFPVGTTQTLITAGSPCLASGCMAWRWDYEYARTEKESKLRPGDPDLDNQGWEMLSESSYQKYWRRRVGGFCGLAEPRVVDVEITQ